MTKHLAVFFSVLWLVRPASAEPLAPVSWTTNQIHIATTNLRARIDNVSLAASNAQATADAALPKSDTNRFATAAQGAKADSAYQFSQVGSTTLTNTFQLQGYATPYSGFEFSRNSIGICPDIGSQFFVNGTGLYLSENQSIGNVLFSYDTAAHQLFIFGDTYHTIINDGVIELEGDGIDPIFWDFYGTGGVVASLDDLARYYPVTNPSNFVNAAQSGTIATNTVLAWSGLRTLTLNGQTWSLGSNGVFTIASSGGITTNDVDDRVALGVATLPLPGGNVTNWPYYTPFSSIITPASGTATVSVAVGSQPSLTITAPTVIQLDPTGFPTTGVCRVSLNFYSGTNAVTFATNVVSYATVPTVSTSCWNTVLFRRTANCIWKGAGL